MPDLVLLQYVRRALYSLSSFGDIFVFNLIFVRACSIYIPRGTIRLAYRHQPSFLEERGRGSEGDFFQVRSDFSSYTVKQEHNKTVFVTKLA